MVIITPPLITGNIHKQLQRTIVASRTPALTDRERELLNYLCTEQDYTEISKRMFLSESTVDTHRARLFERFEVKNRIGLILKAVNLVLIKL